MPSLLRHPISAGTIKPCHFLKKTWGKNSVVGMAAGKNCRDCPAFSRPVPEKKRRNRRGPRHFKSEWLVKEASWLLFLQKLAAIVTAGINKSSGSCRFLLVMPGVLPEQAFSSSGNGC